MKDENMEKDMQDMSEKISKMDMEQVKELFDMVKEADGMKEYMDGMKEEMKAAKVDDDHPNGEEEVDANGNTVDPKATNDAATKALKDAAMVKIIDAKIKDAVSVATKDYAAVLNRAKGLKLLDKDYDYGSKTAMQIMQDCVSIKHDRKLSDTHAEIAFNLLEVATVTHDGVIAEGEDSFLSLMDKEI